MDRVFEFSSSGQNTEASVIGILTEPNLIVDENQGFPLFDNFFFQFYCILYDNLLKSVVFFWLKNELLLKKYRNFAKKRPKDSVLYFCILPNRAE